MFKSWQQASLQVCWSSSAACLQKLLSHYRKTRTCKHTHTQTVTHMPTITLSGNYRAVSKSEEIEDVSERHRQRKGNTFKSFSWWRIGCAAGPDKQDASWVSGQDVSVIEEGKTLHKLGLFIFLGKKVKRKHNMIGAYSTALRHPECQSNWNVRRVIRKDRKPGSVICSRTVCICFCIAIYAPC